MLILLKKQCELCGVEEKIVTVLVGHLFLYFMQLLKYFVTLNVFVSFLHVWLDGLIQFQCMGI